MNLFEKFHHQVQSFHKPVISDLSPAKKLLQEINQLHPSFRNKTDSELKHLANELKQKAIKTANLDELLVEAYALVKEVCFRQLGMLTYDVQILAAIALHNKTLVEMQTGEGKTLAAVFPAYLNALTGKGVHILTFNDYLAKRDANWMRPVYEFLGMSVGFMQERLSKIEKRKAYQAAITYATAKSVGFDYLRAFMTYDKSDIVQRPFHFAIVDEADAILIDEARTPLVLAGNIIDAELDFYKIASMVDRFENNVEYELSDESRVVFMTQKGSAKAEQLFNVDLYDGDNFGLLSAINLAIHAKVLLEKDVHYVIKNGAIKLIDDFTGRIVEDRKWRNGLQTAVEAKEGLKIQTEGKILNSITIQHLLHLYPTISGMTATAQSSAEEFEDFYGLPTIVIPPNKTCKRNDHPDLLFPTKQAKTAALIEEVKKVHQTGQPILIGTLTVKESETLAAKLKLANISCQVLNARNDEKEAEIIAKAGKTGAVTISTNMAGRGTDILLGGSDLEDQEKVIDLGGLYVIGTNRHESERIDRQLRGRAGRQGDIGASRFFSSFEDDLMKKYKFEEILPKKYLEKSKTTDLPIEDKTVHHFVNITQGIIDDRMFEMRKTLYFYAELIEKQRIIFQNERQGLLFLDDFSGHQILDNFDFPKPGTIEKARQLVLFQYDKHWANHLENLSRIREGIASVRLGGQQPLRQFQRMAHEAFEKLYAELDHDIQAVLKLLSENPEASLEALGMKKPSSTWTYLINDNPFGDQLSIMLLDNSNIVMGADPISAMMLFFFKIFKKEKPLT